MCSRLCGHDRKAKDEGMRVAAIVVTYNRKALLYRCVEHLLRQAGLVPEETA